MSIYSVIWHFLLLLHFCHFKQKELHKINIRGYIPFSRLSRLNRNRHLQSKAYNQICYQQVRISQKWLQQKLKKRPKWGLNSWASDVLNCALLYLFLRAMLYKTGCYQPILLILRSKHRVKEFYINCVQIWKNWTKIATVRVTRRKRAKWPPWRHRFWNF